MDASDRYRFEPSLRWNPQVEEYFIKAYGADHFARISKSLTRPSCYSCIRVNTLKSTNDVILKSHRKSAETRQQSAIDDMNQSDANQLLVASRKVHNSKCQLPRLDYCFVCQRFRPHNIAYAHAQDKPPKEIIVSQNKSEVRFRKCSGIYVPGVLACSAHVEKGDAIAMSVDVERPTGWWMGRWYDTWNYSTGLQTGKSAAVICEYPNDLQHPYFSERSGLYIGQGATMMSRAGMFRYLLFLIICFLNFWFSDVRRKYFAKSPSIITAHALDPQQGDRILDMCAAPGGKTTAIAILMKDKGEVVAVDRSHNKVQFLTLSNSFCGIGASLKHFIVERGSFF
ncbi:putative methyltransferase NSUN6 [Camellia lanceoleosa]|uniref:Methyltransferase NSUN6 n=1 Tax=Camellia lanceoleosa TaxID=1840588 RepID=A0ACC0I7T7_9ERIC|nr:putative methyltransferase NSUN6 [Camellia lanceoleosa]